MSHSPRSFPHFVSRSPCGVVAMDQDIVRYQLDRKTIDFNQTMIDKEVVIPRTQSLENGDLVEFTYDMHFSLKPFNKMRHGLFLSASGTSYIVPQVNTPPIPLYLSHVLWSLGFQCTKVADDAFKLSLAHIGAHLSHDRRTRPDPDVNTPKDLEKPEILAASFTFLSAPKTETGERFNLTADLEAPRIFSSSELMRHAFKDPLTGNDVHIRIRIVIARSYFSLANLIDLEVKPTVERDRLVASILRGEKPAGSDWRITVGQTGHASKGQGDAASGPSSFHVHKETLASRSAAFKKLFDSAPSPSSTGSCPMPTFTSDDMKVAIPLFYGTAVPLPEKLGDAAALIKKLQRFFKPDLLATDLYPHWERAICKTALALDKTSDASMIKLAYLLTLIWTCPYGSMPVAKRVAIGAMADLMHRKGRKHYLNYMEAWGDEVDLMMCLGGNINHPMWAIYSHHGKVVVVHKRLFTAAKPAATAAAPVKAAPYAAVTSVYGEAADDATTPPSADAAAGNCVIQLPDDDEEWHDAETIDILPERGNQMGCVIC